MTPHDEEHALALQLVEAAWRDGLRPDADLSLVEWSERHRVLTSESSARPGPYRFDVVPYLREIAENLSVRSDVPATVLQKGAQIGASDLGCNFLGYVMDQAPGPIVYLLPNQDLCKKFAHQRLQPMVDATPRLAARVTESRERKGADTMMLKQFPGGILALLGANSAAGLRSVPARFLVCDEVDAYPPSLEEEGDPLDLAQRATRSFGSRAKRFFLSTPTVAGRSRITALYEASDQRRFFVPCPSCGEFQILYWTDKKTGRRGVCWEGEGLALEVWYSCEKCGARIPEAKKEGMLARGEWRPAKPERSHKVRGYHLSALYAPVGMFSWTSAVEQFLAAKQDGSKLRVFVNHTLGEPWVDQGDAPPWEELYRRRERYPVGTVPKGGYLLTCGVDVQRNRIEAEVVAWGPRLESWSVDYVVLEGDTADEAVWDKLDELLARTFPTAEGLERPIKLTCIDSGFATQAVYHYCRVRHFGNAHAVRGVDHLDVLVALPTLVDMNHRGRRLRRGVHLWSVGVSKAKQELYGFLRQPAPLKPEDRTPFGFCHFPEYGEEYFRQLTAEQLERKPTRRGFDKYEWVKVHERNEALDCRNYARAAAAIVGIDRFSEADWARAAGGYTSRPVDEAAPRRATERSGYWDRFR